MDDRVIQNALAYASRYQLRPTARLGFGIHGIVFSVVGNLKEGATVIKAHHAAEPFHRELAIYARLKEAKIRKVLGFNVPHLINHDADLHVIEMSLVARPFVLDFAGAYLDAPPVFDEEAWERWETDNRERFGERWPQVQAVLAALEEMDIHMIDVLPGNIAFIV